tara:strand:+ start:4813 stop:5052 length:240 start_codon:yes stop_codon:yes gene_type:complete
MASKGGNNFIFNSMRPLYQGQVQMLIDKIPHNGGNYKFEQGAVYDCIPMGEDYSINSATIPRGIVQQLFTDGKIKTVNQ